MLKHFVVSWGKNCDCDFIEEMALDFFGDNKCMVVFEKATSNPHYHFQGECTLSENEFRVTREKWAKKHPIYINYIEQMRKWTENGCPAALKPKSVRPIKNAKECDEKGFQYMSKEKKPPVFIHGFSEDEIVRMQQDSDEHVEHLKNGLKEFLHSNAYDNEPVRAHKRMRLDALEYYEKEDKRPRPQFQKDVLWAMYTHPSRTDVWKEYVAERI